jgi:hypothetical protein
MKVCVLQECRNDRSWARLRHDAMLGLSPVICSKAEVTLSAVIGYPGRHAARRQIGGSDMSAPAAHPKPGFASPENIWKQRSNRNPTKSPPSAPAAMIP